MAHITGGPRLRGRRGDEAAGISDERRQIGAQWTPGRLSLRYHPHVGKLHEHARGVIFEAGETVDHMQDVEIKQKECQMSREDALLLMRKFVVPDDLGTPPGAVTLRGATNFQTPSGWDTVYTPVFNAIERPAPPMLVVRVETDWYMHESEFRYVLQPGEGISGQRTMPIGQVFFVPREEITLRRMHGRANSQR